MIAAATGSKVAVWTADGGVHQVVLPPTGSTQALAVSPSGRYVAIIGDGLALIDREKNTVRTARASSPYAVGMPNDARLVIADGGGSWQVLSLPGLANILGPTTVSTGVHQIVQTLSANGHFVGYSNGSGIIPVWNTGREAGLGSHQDLTGLSHGSDPQALSISPDGKRVAVADGGTIYVSGTSPGSTANTYQLSLPGNNSITAIQFLGDDNQLVSVTGSSLALWDLDQAGRIGLKFQIKVPYACEACPPPQPYISPDGKLAATLAGSGEIYVHDLFSGNSDGGALASYQFLGWDTSSNKIFFTSSNGRALDAAQVSDHQIRVIERHPIPSSNYQILAFSPASNQLVEISDSGDARMVPLSGSGEKVAISSAHPPVGYNLIEQVVDPTLSYLGEQFESDKALNTDTKIITLKTGHVRDLGSGIAPGITFTGKYLLVQRANADMEIWDSSGTTMRYLIQEDQSYMPGSSAVKTSPAVVGPFLVQERSDGTLAVTQMSSGTFLGALPAPSLKTGMSADGAGQLVSVTEGAPATGQGTLIRWELSPQSWIRNACAAAGRHLTSTDWQQYGSGPTPSFLACSDLS